MLDLSLNCTDAGKAREPVQTGFSAITAQPVDIVADPGAGLIVCPEIIPPSEWLKLVWNQDGEFETPAQMQTTLSALMAHYSRVSYLLVPPVRYAPAIEEVAETGEVLWEFWIEGFMDVMQLRHNAWKSLIRNSDDATSDALLCLLELSNFARNRGGFPAAKLAEVDETASETIAEAIWELNRYAKSLPPEAMFGNLQWGRPAAANIPNAPHRGKKPGRNDPCPCGSGKKFKACCGKN